MKKKKQEFAEFSGITYKEKTTLRYELKRALKQFDDDEIVLAYCTMVNYSYTPRLWVMTNQRFIHVFQQKIFKTGLDTYQFDNIQNPYIIHRKKSVDFTFQYHGQTNRFTFTDTEKNMENIRIMKTHVQAEEKTYNDNDSRDIHSVKQKLIITFVDGSQELGLAQKYARMIQLSNGDIYFEEGKNATERFTLHHYDRAENMKKSTVHSLGYTMVGSAFFGTTGAIGMAAGSMKGKDLSTAVLLLTNQATNAKQAAVIQCDSSTYAKFSKLTTVPEEEQQPETIDPNQYEQLEKIHELKEKGILSEEEFEAEKAKLLK